MEKFLEKRDAEKSGGDAGLSPRLVGICRKRAAIFPQPSFRDSPFLYPVFAIITGVLKHLFTEPPSIHLAANGTVQGTARGRSGRKKSGQGTLPDGGTALGCRKVDFWFPLARKKPEICFPTSEAGLSGQKSIKRTQKHVVLGVFGHFPKISKRPCAKNIIDTAFSFEDRSGATIYYFL